MAEGEVEVVEAASKVPVFATEGERAVAGMQVGACGSVGSCEGAVPWT